MNAELDGTVGPILKTYADRAGVVYTNADGDQPGVQMNLYRFVRGIGVRPVLCGNIKGLHDPYRNPTTQEGFAKQWGQNPQMVTSFADGTKISFEQAIVANATGMRVARRGMHGLEVEAGTPIEQAAQRFSADELREGDGIVDYVVGAVPCTRRLRPRDARRPDAAPLPQPLQARRGAALLLLHAVPPLPFRGAEHGGARGALRRRGARAGRRAARRGRDRGEDGPRGGLDASTGWAATRPTAWPRTRTRPPPSSSCRSGSPKAAALRRDVKRDDVLRYDDVDVPEGRVADRLRAEQDAQVLGRLPGLPRRLARGPELLEHDLVAQRVHRVPEARVLVGGELALVREALERLALPDRVVAARSGRAPTARPRRSRRSPRRRRRRASRGTPRSDRR